MKEDIKILEDYLDKQDRKYVSEYRLMILQAIENLIERNKELENKCKELNFKYTAQWVDDNYIPKSKIKEKIKYYKELYKQDNAPNEFLINQDCLSKLSILQELLEDDIEKHIPRID